MPAVAVDFGEEFLRFGLVGELHVLCIPFQKGCSFFGVDVVAAFEVGGAGGRTKVSGPVPEVETLLGYHVTK